MKKQLLMFMLAVGVSPAWAGATASSFFVKLDLQYREKCVSETLSQKTNALVQVVCRSGQFVSIDPSPGKPFLGVHGGAFRYFFSLGFGGYTDNGVPLVSESGQANPYVGYGTVTGLRVFNPQGVDDPFEFLVSF